VARQKRPKLLRELRTTHVSFWRLILHCSAGRHSDLIYCNCPSLSDDYFIYYRYQS